MLLSLPYFRRKSRIEMTVFTKKKMGLGARTSRDLLGYTVICEQMNDVVLGGVSWSNHALDSGSQAVHTPNSLPKSDVINIIGIATHFK